MRYFAASLSQNILLKLESSTLATDKNLEKWEWNQIECIQITMKNCIFERLVSLHLRIHFSVVKMFHKVTIMMHWILKICCFLKGSPLSYAASFFIKFSGFVQIIVLWVAFNQLPCNRYVEQQDYPQFFPHHLVI